MTRRSVWVLLLAMAGTLGLLGGCSRSNEGGGGQGGTSTVTGGTGGVVPASGGATPISGGSGSGGAATGGTTGSGGAKGLGGVRGSGGAQGSGGAMGSGGTTIPGTMVGNCPGSCPASALTSCSSPQVRVTPVNLGTALSYSTEETNVVPLMIAAKPGGGSLIAWMTGYSHYGSSTTSQVHIGELDCEDKLVGTPFTLEAHDFQDIGADGDGGVVTVTRDGAATGDAQHCGDVNKLCGLPSDRPGCYDHAMVRFDCAGKEQWAAKLTTTTASAPLYTSGSGSNHGVWWYQHQGRLAFDGTNYAAYFCDAITVANGACVDIHEGDRMQVVGPTGTVLTGHDSFAGGCSHSWSTRLVWDPRSKHFVMVCATDNNCRIAQPNPYRTIVSGTCDGTLFGGDVVNAGTIGYWMAWSYQGKIKLEHFSTGASDKTVATAGTTQNPHLVAYGANKMLLTWKSGTGIAAQVYDAGTGDAVGAQFTIAAPDHPWQSFKPFPDGSVAWAGVGSASATIQIARVMPCSD